MKLFCAVLVFFGVFALNNAQAAVTLKRAATDQLLVQQLLNARANNPSYVQPCFDIYIPIYNAILEEYSSSYQLCISNANETNTELDNEAKGNQTLITAEAQDVCNSMIDCSALEDSLEFLDCYSQIGDGNIKSLYTLTNNASKVAANLREAYRVVQYDLVACQNASEAQYVQSSVKANDALDNCLKNGPPEVVTTTTPEPETTTESPATTESTDSTSVEPESAFEEEDLSRVAPAVPAAKAPPVVTASKYNRYSKRQRT